jgi:sugar phosphate isomerase/epimerase
VTRYAEENKVRVVLYPHSKCYIESAEQALPFVKRNHSIRLGLAVHLCHEIRAGNAHRIGEVVNAVRPFIGAVTLCGTDSLADFRTAYTMDTTTIKPLDKGNFDTSGFLSAVGRSGYRGAIGFINFSIKEKPPGYLKRSIQKWNLLKQQL